MNQLAFRLILVVFFAAPVVAEEPQPQKPTPPSAEMLLFLAEFSGIENEDFNLLVERGKQDVEQNNETPRDQRGESDE